MACMLMFKGFLVSLAIAVLTSLGVHSATAAAPDQATDTTVRLKLSHQPATLNPDGSVNVVGWLTCSPDLYTFEYSVGVAQATGNGSTFLSGASLPCDGTRHRFVIRVVPYDGTFSRGDATISIYLGLYDAANDADLAAYDSVSIRFR